MYTIHYFSQGVKDDIFALPVEIRAHYFRASGLMKEFGSNLASYGITKPMTGRRGLFEICMEGPSGWGRVFYCTQKGKKIVMLHSIMKKSNKTPKGDVELAYSRMKEVKNGAVSPIE